MYGAAASDPAAPGACEAALAAARLAGDVAHDASVTYARALSRRSAGSRRSRRGRGDPAGDGRRHVPSATSRTRSRGWRRSGPPQRVLDAIDAASRARATLAPGARGRGSAAAGVDGRQAAADRARRVVAGPRRGARRRRPRSARAVPDRRRAARRAGARRAPSSISTASTSETRRASRRRQGIVSRVRAEATSTGSRVSLDVDGRAWRRAFCMHEPYRIVIDVAHHPPGAAAASAARGRAGGRSTPGTAARTRAPSVRAASRRRTSRSTSRAASRPILGAPGDPGGPHARRRPLRVARGAHRARERVRRRSLRVDPLQRERDQDPARRRDLRARHHARRDRRARRRARERDDARRRAPSSRLILGDLRLADQSQRSTRFAQLLERAATLGARREVRRRRRRRRAHGGLLRAGRRRHAERPLRDELHLERHRGAAARTATSTASSSPTRSPTRSRRIAKGGEADIALRRAAKLPRRDRRKRREDANFGGSAGPSDGR